MFCKYCNLEYVDNINQKYCSILCSIKDKIIINKNTSCWEWQKYKDKDGYGELTYHKKRIFAHKYMCQFKNGIKLKGQQVRHLCNNSSCCNPNHLVWGSHKENQEDMVKLGLRNGSKHWKSKLTENQILEIRNIYKKNDIINNGVELAKRFNVSSSMIYNIVKRKNWILI